MITGLNHITLAVTDLDRSLAFYVEVLGFELVHTWPGGAYLEIGGVWLCLALDPARCRRPAEDYSHIAFSIAASSLEQFVTRLDANDVKQWKENRSEGPSIYFLDPDGHKLEAHVGTLESRMRSIRSGEHKKAC